ncbi:hypothetical protein [Undibacterium sp. CCC3.4]|uniref:hypothetical protein n=1 Tax=Undibacterium sp. CCC3.4 TaxID=3048609 RepID=UPI002B2397F2|nr:hypothetical protein [Undibacterium sp. CCC3.4]
MDTSSLRSGVDERLAIRAAWRERIFLTGILHLVFDNDITRKMFFSTTVRFLLNFFIHHFGAREKIPEN